MKKILLGLVALLVVAIVGFGAWWFTGEDSYEYVVDSPQECLAGEEYDAEAGTCYFDFYCETEEECDAVDAKYAQVLDALADEYAEDGHEHSTYGEDRDSDSFETGDSNQSRGEQNESIENIIKALLPEDKLVKIESIDQDSDGVDGTLAYVEPATDDGSQWLLRYDQVDAFSDSGQYKDINEMLTTLIHEYAHIEGLHSSQVEHKQSGLFSSIECGEGEYIITEGCTRSDSYITGFISDFWTEDDRTQANQSNDFGPDHYFENTDWFVTEYAATNSIEDMAESFAFFVMRQQPEADGASKADQKILSFYEYPELVDLRNHMRGGVARVLEIY